MKDANVDNVKPGDKVIIHWWECKVVRVTSEGVWYIPDLYDHEAFAPFAHVEVFD